MKFSDLSKTPDPQPPQAAAIESSKPVFSGHLLDHPMVKLIIKTFDMKVLTASKPKLKPASPGPVQKLTPKQLASLVYNKVDKMYSCPFSKIINKGALTPDQIINMVRRNFVK